MSDLSKILLSVGIGWLGGLITGILLEPFKSWYVRRFTAKRARREIYKEIGKLYQIFCLSNNRSEEGFCHHALKYNPPDTFDFYYQQQREACFLIPDWRGLEGFYEVYKVARAVCLEKGYQPRERPGQNVSLVRSVADEFEYRFQKAHLERDRVLNLAKEEPSALLVDNQV
jgi:hypothetical protein